MLVHVKENPFLKYPLELFAAPLKHFSIRIGTITFR